MPSTAASIYLALTCALQAQAMEKCRDIKDDKSRLACFDAQSVTTPDPEATILKRLKQPPKD
jgi:hypothetical protein